MSLNISITTARVSVQIEEIVGEILKVYESSALSKKERKIDFKI